MTILPALNPLGNFFCHGGQHSTFGNSSGSSTNFPDGFPANYVGGTDYVKRLDFNELGRLATVNKMFVQAGGIYIPKSAIASAGYPKGAVLMVEANNKVYRVVSQVNNNTVLPSINGSSINTAYWRFEKDYITDNADSLGVITNDSDSEGSGASSRSASTSVSKTFTTDVFLLEVYTYVWWYSNPAYNIGGYANTSKVSVNSSVSVTPKNGTTMTLGSYSHSATVVGLNSDSGSHSYNNAIGFLPAGSSVRVVANSSCSYTNDLASASCRIRYCTVS